MIACGFADRDLPLGFSVLRRPVLRGLPYKGFPIRAATGQAHPRRATQGRPNIADAKVAKLIDLQGGQVSTGTRARHEPSGATTPKQRLLLRLNVIVLSIAFQLLH